MEFRGQAEQDKFVVNVLKNKKNGYFVEVGSNHPININNTYILEKELNWKGIMIEYDPSWLSYYQMMRKNSVHVINDATKINYRELFDTNNVPLNIDYLQIDLEVTNNSTLLVLKKFDEQVFEKYKFATITFEHDVWEKNNNNTRELSRFIFDKWGYKRVFDDIHNLEPQYVYEDWYVHPDLVDMDYVNKLITNNKNKYIYNKITQKSINWKDINYNI